MSIGRKAGLLVGVIGGAAMLANAAEGGEGGEGKRGRVVYPPYYVGVPVVRQPPPVVIVAPPPVIYAPPAYQPYYDAPGSPSLNLNLNVPLR
jgi:hypothetical protein